MLRQWSTVPEYLSTDNLLSWPTCDTSPITLHKVYRRVLRSIRSTTTAKLSVQVVLTLAEQKPHMSTISNKAKNTPCQ
jgi:hypothetical protein